MVFQVFVTWYILVMLLIPFCSDHMPGKSFCRLKRLLRCMGSWHKISRAHSLVMLGYPDVVIR